MSKPMSVNDHLLAIARGGAAAAIDYAQRKGAKRIDEVKAYINEVFRLAPIVGLDPAIVIAQSVHETTDPDTDAPWASYWWVNRLNPAGLGITGDEAQNDASKTFGSGVEAAHAHIAHLLLYATGQIDKGGLSPVDDPRYDAYREAYGTSVQATAIKDLTNKWGIDPNYANGVVSRGNVVFPDLSPASPSNGSNQGDPNVPTYTTVVPGLPGGPLVTTYPIEINLIPAANTYQRPGIIAHTPRRSVQHGTGNPNNDDARAEAQYFVNGAEGRQASIHATIDDKRVVIVVPLNEVTWQAADGSGPGNMCGYSSEMLEANAIWNNAARRDAEIAIAADFMGRVAARFSVAIPEQHYTFNAGDPDRHDCPYMLRHVYINGRLAWDIYVDAWNAAKADELKRMGQAAPTIYAAPRPVMDGDKPWDGSKTFTDANGIVWHAEKHTVECVKGGLRCHLWATTDSPDTRAPLASGEKFDVLGWVEGEANSDANNKNENRWWVTPRGTRVWSGGISPKPQSTVPPTRTLPSNPAPVVRGSDGAVFYVAGDPEKGREVTINADGVVSRKYADPNAEVVTTYKSGDKVTVRFWVHGTKQRGEDLYWVAEGDGINGPRISILDTVEKPI